MSCSKYTLVRQLLIFFEVILVSIILTIRTYALYGCSKRLLVCMVIIMVALATGASAGSFGHFSSDATSLPGVGCYKTYTTKTAARLGLAWLAGLVFDIFIFVLIVYRICKTKGLPRLSLVTRRNIIDIIFCDGAMYFGAMVLCQIPNILTFYVDSVATAGMLATFSICISVTLISRLMLNLHKFIDVGILSTPARDDDHNLACLYH
ncbi:uncharacterized protein EDB91DRAFT_811178 [Suillus paluster]|uniref:uncharacterized protein n=1 Tax=Suillus paluster TaxID=48578 RepID=UPI001B8789B8|nr:uncharacterized protein EDB91DRAFT_811178 [Suillus paluster]KAG1729513.1 hypothetical protein EDB91DRAFT_811178 [Suillus paluster]